MGCMPGNKNARADQGGLPVIPGACHIPRIGPCRESARPATAQRPTHPYVTTVETVASGNYVTRLPRGQSYL